MNTSHLYARALFKFRDAGTILIALGLFALMLIVLNIFIGPWLGFFGAIGLTLALFYAFLNKIAIGFDCPECGGYIASNHPWICGFKQCRNDNADDYPFVYRCEHCGAPPKAYQCHHCRKPIFFTNDKLAQNIARCTKPFREGSDLDVSNLKEVRAKVGLELDIAKIEDELNGSKGKSGDTEARRRDEELAELEHKIRKLKKEAELAREVATREREAEANLPFREREEKKYKRQKERYDMADEGRRRAKEKYERDGDSIQYQREMAYWKNFEEDGSILM